MSQSLGFTPLAATPQLTAAGFLPGPDHPQPLLNEYERDQLRLISTPMRVRRGTFLYHQGASAHAVFNIAQGVAKTAVTLPDGRTRLTSFLFSGDLTGMAEDGVHSDSAQAITPLLVWRMPIASLTALLRRDPGLQFHLLCKLCHDLRSAQMHALALGEHDAVAKVARLLHMLPTERGLGGERRIALPMSRREMAEYLAMSPEAVSRALHRLCRDEVLALEGRYAVRVLHPSRFATLGGRVPDQDDEQTIVYERMKRVSRG